MNIYEAIQVVTNIFNRDKEVKCLHDTIFCSKQSDVEFQEALETLHSFAINSQLSYYKELKRNGAASFIGSARTPSEQTERGFLLDSLITIPNLD